MAEWTDLNCKLILKLQFIHSVNGDGSKTAKIIKKVILPTVTSPECQRDAEYYHLFNDFCGFWTVAVNTMDSF